MPVMKTDKSARKFYLAALLLLCSAGAGRAQDGAVVLDEIVAKVNSEIITLTDLKRELDYLRVALQEEIKDPQLREQEFQKRKAPLLKNLIQNKMMIQKAEELGMTANIDVDVAAYLEEMRKNAGIPSLDVLDQYLKQQGTSPAEYRETVRKQIIIDSLIGQFVYSKITLLTPEVEAFYQENIDRFTEPAEVELAEILFLTEGKNRQEVRKKAEEVLAKLKDGVPFADLAREYSEGPTASKGGAIGTFRQGSMNEALEEIVFKLEEGETSGIIEADYGLQIVKVLKKQPPRRKSLDEVRPIVQEALYRKKAQPELKEFIENLREQSYIYVAPKYREEFDVEGLL